MADQGLITQYHDCGGILEGRVSRFRSSHLGVQRNPHVVLASGPTQFD